MTELLADPVICPPYEPGDPRWAELAFLNMGPPGDEVWKRPDRFGTRTRRLGTWGSPLAFAYVYMGRTLKPTQPLLPGDVLDTRYPPMVSFSDFHRGLCDSAKYWIKPGGRRVGIIAPRNSGKSTWAYLILPLWALAHGHRMFFTGFAHSNHQAKDMLDKIRKQLTKNELLLFDFPELRLPKRGQGRNNAQLVETFCPYTLDEMVRRTALAPGMLNLRSRAFSTSGIDRVTLGARHDEDRPDLITIDDGEPDEGNYSAVGKKGSKEDRLKTIRNTILRFNSEAAVMLSGTVVMPGAIGHNLVQAALGEPTDPWVYEERFATAEHRPLYYNAILDEGTAYERSLWPGKWSLEYLLHERQYNSAQFALHYANQPLTSGGAYWQQDDFRYDIPFLVENWIMYVDPAESSKPGSDMTAVVVVGTDLARNNAVVLFARQGHMPDVELGRNIATYRLNHPEIPLLQVFVEGYGSAELRLETLSQYMPAGVKLALDRPPRTVSATGQRGKRARIENAYGHYQQRRVWHAHPFTDLEPLLTSFPNIDKDDLPDALSSALRKAFEGKPWAR